MAHVLLHRKLTARPWKMMVGRQAFPFEMVPFFGGYVNFFGSNYWSQIPPTHRQHLEDAEETNRQAELPFPSSSGRLGTELHQIFKYWVLGKKTAHFKQEYAPRTSEGLLNAWQICRFKYKDPCLQIGLSHTCIFGYDSPWRSFTFDGKPWVAVAPMRHYKALKILSSYGTVTSMRMVWPLRILTMGILLMPWQWRITLQGICIAKTL